MTSQKDLFVRITRYYEVMKFGNYNELLVKGKEDI